MLQVVATAATTCAVLGKCHAQEPGADGGEGGHRLREVQGLTFVRLNRAKRLVDLLVEPMPFDRLSKLGEKTALKLRLVEEECLKSLTVATLGQRGMEKRVLSCFMTGSESIEATLRKRWILFAGFVARMEDTRLPKFQVPVVPVEGNVLAAEPVSPGSDGWTSKVELPSGAAECPPCPVREPCPSVASEASVAQATAVLAASEEGSGKTCAEVMSRCHQGSMAQTTLHIIECSEAGEGGSQEAGHLPRKQRHAAVGQKGAALLMTGLNRDLAHGAGGRSVGQQQRTTDEPSEHPATLDTSGKEMSLKGGSLGDENGGDVRTKPRVPLVLLCSDRGILKARPPPLLRPGMNDLTLRTLPWETFQVSEGSVGL